MKIVVDTNLWISFLIQKKYESIADAVFYNKYKVLVSDSFEFETKNVMSRAKFKKYFQQKDVYRFFELLEKFGVKIDITSDIELCRDPKDNFLLNLAVDGKADFLITGDKDLLVLEQVEGCRIITWREFEDKIISKT